MLRILRRNEGQWKLSDEISSMIIVVAQNWKFVILTTVKTFWTEKNIQISLLLFEWDFSIEIYNVDL